MLAGIAAHIPEVTHQAGVTLHIHTRTAQIQAGEQIGRLVKSSKLTINQNKLSLP